VLDDKHGQHREELNTGTAIKQEFSSVRKMKN